MNWQSIVDAVVKLAGGLVGPIKGYAITAAAVWMLTGASCIVISRGNTRQAEEAAWAQGCRQCAADGDIHVEPDRRRWWRRLLGAGTYEPPITVHEHHYGEPETIEAPQ